MCTGKELSVCGPPGHSSLAQRPEAGCATQPGLRGQGQRVPALSLSSVSGSPRAQGLAAFPENTTHCLPVLPLSSGPVMSYDRIWAVGGRQQAFLLFWPPRPGKPPSQGLQARLGLPLGPRIPQGHMWLHSVQEACLWRAQRKDFVFRKKHRARVTFLMSE